jgi:cell division protein FtsL
MTPEEIKAIIENVLNEKFEYYWLYLLLAVLISLVSVFILQFLKDKGKNYATKQDIASITRKIEDVKAEIQNQQEVEKQKRQLKFDALLKSLNLMDAHLSQVLIPGDGQKIKKQFATTEEARKCHSSLILTCQNTEILEMFSIIMFGQNVPESEKEPLTDLLNKYRNLVRKELDFGTEIPLDRDIAWFGYGNFEEENTNA